MVEIDLPLWFHSLLVFFVESFVAYGIQRANEEVLLMLILAGAAALVPAACYMIVRERRRKAEGLALHERHDAEAAATEAARAKAPGESRR